MNGLLLKITSKDTHRLHFSVIIKGVRAKLAAYAGLLKAAEWSLEAESVVGVNPNSTASVSIMVIQLDE